MKVGVSAALILMTTSTMLTKTMIKRKASAKAPAKETDPLKQIDLHGGHRLVPEIEAVAAPQVPEALPQVTEAVESEEAPSATLIDPLGPNALEPPATLIDRLGPNALDFSRDAEPELVAARIEVSDWFTEKRGTEPWVILGKKIDRHLMEAIAERIRGSDLENRKVSMAHVQDLSKKILSGQWDYNGESIKFTVNGQVLDGQHRALAFLKAVKKNPELTIVTDLRFNVPAESFKTLDTGRVRSATDILGMSGVTQCNHVAAVARVWDTYHRGAMQNLSSGSRIKMSNIQVHTLVKGKQDETGRTVVEGKEKLFLQAVNAAKAACKGVDIPISIMAFALALGFRADADRTNEFAKSLAEGTELQPGSPVLALIRSAPRAKKVQKYEPHQVRHRQAAFVIKALNAFFRGDKIKTLVFRPEEEFPTFVGDDPKWRSQVGAPMN